MDLSAIVSITPSPPHPSNLTHSTPSSDPPPRYVVCLSTYVHGQDGHQYIRPLIGIVLNAAGVRVRSETEVGYQEYGHEDAALSQDDR